MTPPRGRWRCVRRWRRRAAPTSRLELACGRRRRPNGTLMAIDQPFGGDINDPAKGQSDLSFNRCFSASYLVPKDCPPHQAGGARSITHVTNQTGPAYSKERSGRKLIGARVARRRVRANTLQNY